MRIMGKFVLDCDVDAAWRAIHSPAVLAELYGPLLGVENLQAVPTSWSSGDETTVQLRAVGTVPLGRQLIHVTDSERTVDGQRVRILRDSGIPLTGPLGTFDVWDHQMAVSAAPGDPTRTLWRERLVFRGALAPVLWPALWSAWQLRESRLRSFAPTWAFDPESVRDADDARGSESRAAEDAATD